MKEDFIAEIDAALRPAGYSERVRFIRDAVYEKLQILGFKLPKDIASAPGRLRGGSVADCADAIGLIATANAQLNEEAAPAPSLEGAKPIAQKSGPSGVSYLRPKRKRADKTKQNS